MADPPASDALVFVYGTLTDPSVAGHVLDEFAYVGAATLEGLHRVDGDYPTLAPGGSVDGRLLRTAEMAALDAYEGVERGLYVRVGVPLVAAGGDGAAAAVYVGDPDALSAPASWPGEGSFRERVERFVSRESVLVRTNDGRHSPV